MQTGGLARLLEAARRTGWRQTSGSRWMAHSATCSSVPLGTRMPRSSRSSFASRTCIAQSGAACRQRLALWELAASVLHNQAGRLLHVSANICH